MDDEDLQAIVSENLDKAPEALQNYSKKKASAFTFPELDSNDLRDKLWKALLNLLKNPQVPDMDCLILIRILSRDKTALNELMSEDFLKELFRRASRDNCEENVTIESLKCLYNLSFNSSVVVAVVSHTENLLKLIENVREFKEGKCSLIMGIYNMKLLFLVSALCPEVRPKLVMEQNTLRYLMECIGLILRGNSKDDHNSDVKPTHATLLDNQVDFCNETLKVLFNITMKEVDETVDEEEETQYFQLVLILRQLLLVTTQSEAKKLELHNNVINLLTNVPGKCFQNLLTPVQDDKLPKDLQFEEMDMSAIRKIVDFLENRFTKLTDTSSQLEYLSPTLSALLKGACGNRNIRKYLRREILPPLKDVHKRPEEGDTLRNHLCRLLTSIVTQVRDLAAEFLFTLCKENVGRMIKYTGYGNAAGLLANRGLLGGQTNKADLNYSSDSETSDTEEYIEHKHGINPVMGCYEEPHPDPTANMSDEQKEYEAMKLVQLMDSLTKKGIVKPCKIGEDGRPEPIEHVLQLQDGLRDQQL